MSQDHTDTKIELKPASALTRPGVCALANRGLSEVEATESADRWLEKAKEIHWRDDEERSLAMDEALEKYGKDASDAIFDAWDDSGEHLANVRAQFDCWQRAVQVKPDYPKALIALAKAYLQGWDFPFSRGEALRLMKLAAKTASPSELFTMCERIVAKDGVRNPWPEGINEAERMCRRAAEQGHAGAQELLGKMYVAPRGSLQRDDELAMYWFGKAYESLEGFPPAEEIVRYYKWRMRVWEEKNILPIPTFLDRTYAEYYGDWTGRQFLPECD